MQYTVDQAWIRQVSSTIRHVHSCCCLAVVAAANVVAAVVCCIHPAMITEGVPD